jgi:hypothetical protein
MYIHSYKRVIKLQNQGQESYQNVDFELKNALQEVPAFRDFRFHRVIMKCRDHEFQGLFLV